MTTLPVLSGRAVSLRGPSTAAVAASAVVAVLATVDPNEPGHYPTCPVLALTGRFCPGCGSLRAVHALTRGDIAGAVGLNVLTVLAVVPLAVIWVQWVRRSWRGRQRTSVAPAALLWTSLVVIAFFTVVRNLPVGSALAP